MRRVKFRAWHKPNKIMLNVVAINFSLREITADIETSKIYPDLCYWWKETDIPFSEIKLMQYTGLKDKNGVEIYEGDIIKTDLERPYLIVEYRNGAFMLNCNDGSDDYYDIFFGTSEESEEVYKYGEVIGNIHDSHELIEVTK